MHAICIRKVHIEERLKQLNITLPPQPIPKGNYINFVKTGNLVYIAGSLPQPIGLPLIKGRLGENMTIEQGQEAARHAGLNMLATLQIACGGNLDKVTRVVKIVGFINSTNDFTSQATVMNGCSDLFGEVFEAKGRHARSAIGTSVLPLGVPVEVEAIVEVEVEE
jgi:enamine deaminase RidA (YjgF/YER057c/UK114 family)